METLKTLRDQVTQLLDEEGISVTETRVDSLLNQAHKNRLSGRAWSFLFWPQVESLTCTSGQTVYALHSQVGLLGSLTNYTDDTPILETGVGDIHLAEVADKYHFCWVGNSPVRMGETVGELLSLISTAGADSGNTIVVEGTDSSGEVVSETVTCNGTNAVAFTTTFQQILRVRKVGTWTGTLKLLRADGTTVVLTVTASEKGRTYKRIALLADPTVGDVLQYTFYRLPRTMSADDDGTDIPEPHDSILVWDVLLLMSAYHENIKGTTIELWQRMQQDMDSKMRNAFLHGRSAGSQASRIRDADPGGL